MAFVERIWNRNKTQFVTVREINHKDGWDQVVNTGNVLVKTDQGAKYWQRTPNWQNVLRFGNLPMNPFYYSKIFETVTGSSSFRTTNTSAETGEILSDVEYLSDGPDQPYIHAPGVDPLSDRDKERADSTAVTKVLNDAKDQKTNMTQMFAERAQTGKLFETTARRVVDTVVKLRQGNWNGAARGLGVNPSAARHRKHIRNHAKDAEKATASAWLELQYGWKPLLSDVYGAAELIAQKRNRQDRTRVAKSHRVSNKSKDKIVLSPVHSIIITSEQSRTVKYVLYYSTPNEGLHTLTQVGITNPALLAWELLPWSFVVDWFIPIGNYISSWDAALGLQFEKGTKVVVDEFNWTATQAGGTHVSNNGHTKVVSRNSVATVYNKVDLSRVALSGFPSARPPSFKNPFSAEHVANLVALLSTTFRR